MLKADLYFSFRSPYSYLGSDRYRQLTRDWDLSIALRPVYPIAVRNPSFFDKTDPLWVPYLMNDVVRVAEWQGTPFHWPKPDPIAVEIEDGKRHFATDQPLIKWLSRLGIIAERHGKGLDFACEVAHTLWGDAVEDWHLENRLAEPARHAGLDLAMLEAEVSGNEESLDAEILANQTAEEEAGHWGTPCLVFNGEPFFGQDRIELAVWRMKQAGLTARQSD